METMVIRPFSACIFSLHIDILGSKEPTETEIAMQISRCIYSFKITI